MARRKAPRIPDALLDQLLAGANPKTAFEADGLLDELKKVLGTEVRIMSVPFEVVGVLDAKGPDQDDVVFVPLETAKLRFLGSASGVNRDAVAYIVAKAVSDEAMGRART
ncbi:ABC transporter permease, partial [Methylobacterium longum]|uniref:ABC transporter permease n=1 Tax=Methylobacterium longum TaxID=767694 RepID=UPI001EE34685